MTKLHCKHCANDKPFDVYKHHKHSGSRVSRKSFEECPGEGCERCERYRQGLKKCKCPILARCPVLATRCPELATWCPVLATWCPELATRCLKRAISAFEFRRQMWQANIPRPPQQTHQEVQGLRAGLGGGVQGRGGVGPGELRRGRVRRSPAGAEHPGYGRPHRRPKREA